MTRILQKTGGNSLKMARIQVRTLFLKNFDPESDRVMQLPTLFLMTWAALVGFVRETKIFSYQLYSV